MPTARKRRILLLDVPRLLGDLVRAAVARHQDLEVVADVTEDEAGAAIADTVPDCVIVGGNRATPPPPCRAAFDTQPHLVVLALAGDGREGTLWELAPHRLALGELSRDSLLKAVANDRRWSWDT